MNRKWIAAALLLGMAPAANAAVVLLQSVTPVSDGFQFDYQVTLGPDEGLKPGDRLVIFDFAGFVEGSLFSTGDFATAVEFSSLPFLTPGYSDDPGMVNFVLTYTGPEFRTSGGPFESIVAAGFGAVSIFGNTRLDAFTSATTKNSPGAAEGTDLIQGGVTLVPGMVPEPATWGMIIVGFGMLGAFARRQRHAVAVAQVAC